MNASFIYPMYHLLTQCVAVLILGVCCHWEFVNASIRLLNECKLGTPLASRSPRLKCILKVLARALATLGVKTASTVSELFQNVPEHSSIFWTFVPDSCHFLSFFDVSCHCSSFFDVSCHCSSFFDDSCHCYCSLMTAVILIVLVLIVLQIHI